MRHGIAWATVLALAVCVGLAGCDQEKKTAGDPPIRLGLAPGETAAYEPAAPTPPPPDDYGEPAPPAYDQPQGGDIPF